jgi:predicted DNA binding CopG/RHH family protein
MPVKLGRKKIGKRISLILPEETILELNQISKEKGMGYQTLARMFILEKIEELHQKKVI